ncbi:hypothetical protein AB3N59_07630 [Leptospira sp. WS92.C1]
MQILLTRIPKSPGIKKLIFHGLFSLMEPQLRDWDAMGLSKPICWIEILTICVFKIRVIVLRTISPRRKKPFLVTKRKNSTYKNGYLIENLGPHPTVRMRVRSPHRRISVQSKDHSGLFGKEL